MRAGQALLIAIGAMGCRQILDIDPGVVRGDAASTGDAPGDAPVVPDMMIVDAFTGWQNLAPVPGLATGDEDPSLTADQLELYVTRGLALYVYTRLDLASAWSTATLVAFPQGASTDQTPEITQDGLYLVFATDRGAGAKLDVYFIARATRTSPWATNPAPLPDLNESSFDDRPGSPNSDGSRIVMSSDRFGNGTGIDLYEAERLGGLGTPYLTPVRMPLSTTGEDGSPHLSADGLTLYYASGAAGARDLYVATRASLNDPFTSGTKIEELSTPFNDSDPWVSVDGKEIYFQSNRDGTTRIYHATRL